MAKKITLIVSLVLVLCFSTVLLVSAANDNEQSNSSNLTNDTKILLDSPLFTAVEDKKTYEQAPVDMEGFEEVLSNDNLVLYMDNSQIIRIKNKHTGYIWGSDLPGVDTSKVPNAMYDILVNPLTLTVFNTKDNVSVKKTSEFLETDRDLPDEMANKVTVSVNYPKFKVSFKYTIKLEENGINIRLDNKSIKESEAYLITDICFYQYLGSVNSNKVPGYIVIPSGNGGLIRYTEHSNITSLYSATFYGKDYNQADATTETFSLPMFGFVHGVEQNACLVSINEGDAIAKFNYASPNNAENTGYHTAYASYLFRQPVSLSLPGVEKNIVICPKERYTSNVDFSYTFLSEEDADYVGIAKEYKSHLKDRGELKQKELAYPMPMHIETFGREYEQGLLFKEYHNMTTASQILDIDSELKAEGVDRILYTLRGYYKGGYSNSDYSNISFDNSLGQLSSLKELEYYMYYNPVESYSDVDKEVSYSLISSNREYVRVVVETGAKYRLLTNVDCVIDGIKAAQDKYGQNLMFAGVTEYLYGDYDNNYSREQALKEYDALMGTNEYPMYSPNKYFLDNTSEYLNIDLYHEKLTFVTDSVPLLQIVLKGSIDMYSTFINFSSNPDIDRLKCVEYGVYPAYLITQAPSHKLSNTLSNNFYATEYARVKDRMVTDYDFISTALNEVTRYEILDRNVIAPGVIEVVYGNVEGVACRIFVNYSDRDYAYNDKTIDITIKSNGYEVIK